MTPTERLQQIIEDTAPNGTDADHTIWDDLSDLIKWNTVTVENLETILENWDWDFDRDRETVVDLIQALADDMKKHTEQAA